MEEPELGGIVPPSRFCTRHQPCGTDDPCGGCARARKYRDEHWPLTEPGQMYTQWQSTAIAVAKDQGRQDSRMAQLAMFAGCTVEELIARAFRDRTPEPQRRPAQRMSAQTLPVIDAVIDVDHEPEREVALRSHGQLRATVMSFRNERAERDKQLARLRELYPDQFEEPAS
ncbi:hypothetical protein VT930_11970 [Mycobacterium sherrisii]|uniref:hypothetical protein n=1 Tax=Mycobacterium sherrisii TaxID=243061 RepID=UPI002DDD2B7B|nr:hypothetical protein [Mycobacterium sherrisii]MEC4763821.1 hypothetical protein [Mycobacterium sherrisii]